MTVWKKLVRDKICDKLERRGIRCETTIVPEDERQAHLLQKLVEEANECLQASDEDLDDELADVLEVVEAIIAVTPGINLEHVRARQVQKKMFKGGFERGVFLISTEGE